MHPLAELEAVQSGEADVEDEAVGGGVIDGKLLRGCEQTDVVA